MKRANYPQGEKSLRGWVERRGRDSNPEVREDAGFRDRCIAVLPPLRGVLLIRAVCHGGKRRSRSLRPCLSLTGRVRTGWDSFSSRISGESPLQPCCKGTGENPTCRQFYTTNGRGGIRTHVTLVMSTHFPGVRLQPLGHPSRTAVCLSKRRSRDSSSNRVSGESPLQRSC